MVRKIDRPASRFYSHSEADRLGSCPVAKVFVRCRETSILFRLHLPLRLINKPWWQDNWSKTFVRWCCRGTLSWASQGHWFGLALSRGDVVRILFNSQGPRVCGPLVSRDIRVVCGPNSASHAIKATLWHVPRITTSRLGIFRGSKCHATLDSRLCYFASVCE